MTTTISKSAIEAEIAEKGFSHVKFPKTKNFGSIISSLGEIIQQTEIRENPKSTRLLASNHGMNFHTDHNAAKYIAWFCNSQSSTGGGSLLIDTKSILQHFSESSLNLLQEVSVKTHQVFYGDKLSLPLLSVNGNKTIIYYAEWLVNIPSCIKHKKTLSQFEDQIKSTEPIKILLSEGDLLIIDNHRMLHGREAFPQNSNRWLTRHWIKQTQF